MEEERREELLELGSARLAGRDAIHCLTIVGQIEGHQMLSSQTKTTRYEHILPLLASIEESPDIDGLLILLNTAGGDVEAGLAIAELIAGMDKPTVSLVLGGGHSIGVPLAVAAKTSFIVPSATMTIHPVRMNGMMLGVPQTMNYFEKMQDRITRFVAKNSHIKPERFKELMMERDELVLDIGTVLDGKAAVEEGLIDNCGSLSDAVKRLYEMIEEEKAKNPEKIVKKAAKSSKSTKSTKSTKKTTQKSSEKGEKKRKAVAVKSRNAEINGALYGAIPRDLRGEQR